MSISLLSQRVIHNTTDISVAVNDYLAANSSISYTAGQYLYIGASSPFSNIWIEFATPVVSTVGAPTVQIWFGNAWVSVVDVIDQTSGMTATGRISWTVDRLKGWDREQDSARVTGLSSFAIYDRYWLRMSWGSSFSASIAFIGQKFSTDTVLRSYYPDLMQSTILTGYKAGKTNWDEQHYMAAEKILSDLRKRNFIEARGQVFDWESFSEASCRKVAEIAYAAFGIPYRDHVNNARKDYEEAMKESSNLDTNFNGHMDEVEQKDRQGWMVR